MEYTDSVQARQGSPVRRIVPLGFRHDEGSWLFSIEDHRPRHLSVELAEVSTQRVPLTRNDYKLQMRWARRKVEQALRGGAPCHLAS